MISVGNVDRALGIRPNIDKLSLIVSGSKTESPARYLSAPEFKGKAEFEERDQLGQLGPRTRAIYLIYEAAIGANVTRRRRRHLVHWHHIDWPIDFLCTRLSSRLSLSLIL